MATHSIEIVDSDTISEPLLNSRVPTTVTRRGDTVGIFYPTPRPWTEADSLEFHRQTSRVQQMLGMPVSQKKS